MRAARKPRRILHPAVAVTLFLFSGGVAAASILRQFGGSAAEGVDSLGEGLVAMLADEADADADTVEEGAAPGRDLLAAHGSYVRGGAVRLAFAPVDAASPASAPIGETKPASVRWTGQDPPALHIGVVMVTAEARRAVIDGVVVGVGDTTGKVLVLSIERDGVTVQWEGRRLAYDLDNEYPREFRAELAQRGSQDQEPDNGGKPKSDQEAGK